MQKINFKMILLLGAALLLAGCDSESKRIVDLHLHYITTDSAPVATVDSNAQAQLAQTADSVGTSLQQLSAVQLATHPGAKIQHPLNANAIGMGQIASLNWTGPVETLLNKLATSSHYKVSILGNRPAIPVLVSMDVENKTIAYMVRDVAYQVVNKARVTIYPKTRTIELRYQKA
ncbi:MAG: type IVB secretion system lipoprotein DotD [Gammaproteobacteria bacterium]|nr:type IVB secretion system lipoprotein DotD [Gammaproteobacteria bacterium]